MGGKQTSAIPVTNGLLSKAEREFLRGENDVQNPEGYTNNLRYRARNRIQQIEDDLELLADTGHEDIVREFHDQYGQLQDLQQQVNEIQAELDELKNDS